MADSGAEPDGWERVDPGAGEPPAPSGRGRTGRSSFAETLAARTAAARAAVAAAVAAAAVAAAADRRRRAGLPPVSASVAAFYGDDPRPVGAVGPAGRPTPAGRPDSETGAADPDRSADPEPDLGSAPDPDSDEPPGLDPPAAGPARRLRTAAAGLDPSPSGFQNRTRSAVAAADGVDPGLFGWPVDRDPIFENPPPPESLDEFWVWDAELGRAVVARGARCAQCECAPDCLPGCECSWRAQCGCAWDNWCMAGGPGLTPRVMKARDERMRPRAPDPPRSTAVPEGWVWSHGAEPQTGEMIWRGAASARPDTDPEFMG